MVESRRLGIDYKLGKKGRSKRTVRKVRLKAAYSKLTRIKAVARTRRSTRVFTGSALSSAAFGAEHACLTNRRWTSFVRLQLSPRVELASVCQLK